MGKSSKSSKKKREREAQGDEDVVVTFAPKNVDQCRDLMLAVMMKMRTSTLLRSSRRRSIKDQHSFLSQRIPVVRGSGVNKR